MLGKIEAGLDLRPPHVARRSRHATRLVVAEGVPAHPLGVAVAEGCDDSQLVARHRGHLGVRNSQRLRFADVAAELAKAPAVVAASPVGAAEILHVPALTAAIADYG